MKPDETLLVQPQLPAVLRRLAVGSIGGVQATASECLMIAPAPEADAVASAGDRVMGASRAIENIMQDLHGLQLGLSGEAGEVAMRRVGWAAAYLQGAQRELGHLLEGLTAEKDTGRHGQCSLAAEPLDSGAEHVPRTPGARRQRRGALRPEWFSSGEVSEKMTVSTATTQEESLLDSDDELVQIEGPELHARSGGLGDGGDHCRAKPQCVLGSLWHQAPALNVTGLPFVESPQDDVARAWSALADLISKGIV